MAIHVLESREGRLAELLRLLMPFPGRLEFAARLALICAITTLVVEIYQTPEPALTAYVVFFLNKPDRGTSLILNIAMLVLFSVIITSVILVTTIVISQPVWRVASMAAISVGLLFLASASKLCPIGGIVALIVAYALDLLGTVHGGEIATRALLYVWLFIGIPAAVSIGVNLLLASPPRRLAEQMLARRLRLAAAMLCAPNEGLRRDITECLREGNGELQKWLKLALVEKTSAREQIEALRQAAASSFEILSLIDVMDRDVDAALPTPLRERLTLTLDAMARILDEGGYPVDIEFEEAADGEPSLPPRAAEVLAGSERRSSPSPRLLPTHSLTERLLPSRSLTDPQGSPAGSFCPMLSPIQSVSIMRSRPPRQPCSAIFSIRCLTGPEFISPSSPATSFHSVRLPKP
jgi:multidrug resistance protein MdtO